MKMKKRLLSALLSLVLVLGLMPGMSLTAYAEDYPLWVGGTRVTSTNLSDEGWSYAADTNTLTLNGVDITTGYEYPPQSNWFFGINYVGPGKLEIVLASGSDNKIGVNGSLTVGVGGTTVFSGSGSLTVKGSNYGIMGNSVEVKEGEVNASGSTGVYATNEITIGENASLIATGTQSALSGTVKNAAAGTGWTNTEGTAGEAAIAISTTGQDLGRFSFKKVQFQANVPVTGVTLNPSAAQTIDVDGKVSFTATVSPDNATDKKVKWSVGGTNTGAVKLYTDEACTTEVGANATDKLTVYAKGISAGSATVTATSNADSTKSASCAVTVNKADPTAPTSLTATYGQTLANVTLPDGWTWADSTQSVGSVGSNTFKANFAGDSNYNAASDVDVTVTVGKAANPATVTSTATVIKGGNTIDLKDNVTKNGATGDVGYAIDGEAKGCTLNGSVLTSGDTTGTVTVNVTVATDDNYNALAATPITVTISDKGTQTITAADVTVTYGDTDKKVNASVTDPATGGGAVSYAVKDGSADYIDVNASTGALTIKKVPADGKAYVVVTAAGTAAYEQATKDVTVNISKATVTITAKDQSIYVGGTVPTLSGADFYTVTGLVGEETLTTNPTLTYQKNGSAAIPDNTTTGTYDIVASGASAGDNYAISYTKGTLTIISSPPSGPSTISATVTFKVAHGAWDDGTKDNKTVTLTGYSPLTLSTSQIPAVGSKPDEGYKAGSWDTVPATSITRSITFTYSYVKKPAASITKEPTARDLTENGKPQELVTAGEATGGTMEYALGVTADGWSTSIPTATNARVYFVWNKVVGDADHSSTEPKCIVVTVKYGPGTLIYNGKDQELVKPGTVQGGTMMYVLGTDDVTAPGEGWTDVIPKGKEVGDYYVWYKVLGDANHKDTEPRCIKVTIVPDSQVEQFEELIKTLPEKVTLENSDLVKVLRALYDSLSDDQKKLIPDEDVRKLETAEEKINGLNRAAAERFTIAVNAIPRSEAGEGKGMLDAATEIYNNITEEQKALVAQETMDLYNEELAAFTKDRQFRSGDGYYKVLSNGDVTYLKPASRDITDVLVPNQVKKGKFFFKVIKVSNNAFRNCKNLKWAVISKNVYVFGQYIFARDENLTKVRVLGTGFKSGKVTDAFVRAGDGGLTVKVPGSKVDEYRELFINEGGLDGKVGAA